MDAWILGEWGREIDCEEGTERIAEVRGVVFRRWACLVLDLQLEGLFR